MQVIKVLSYRIELTEEEMTILTSGLGRTSTFSRKEAGMTHEEAKWFSDLYTQLDHVQETKS
jgi:hypothetical protein